MHLSSRNDLWKANAYEGGSILAHGHCQKNSWESLRSLLVEEFVLTREGWSSPLPEQVRRLDWESARGSAYETRMMRHYVNDSEQRMVFFSHGNPYSTSNGMFGAMFGIITQNSLELAREV